MAISISSKRTKRRERRMRLRHRMGGYAERPRLSVFRSNRFISLQLIDDKQHHTLCAIDERALDLRVSDETRIDRAFLLGKLMAEKARGKNIEKVVFDRGGYAYKGIVKAVAEGARKGGLIV
ncbi:MAG: large subunit ribosomal protein L18 [Parcubacteria group bacterium Gr01-1014_66]|nr:MAG: large subunit ribosomal protein L18 [Parcubacteria group bacterium Gr01-1014_66]